MIELRKEPESEPKHMAFARMEMGVAEMLGSRDNPRIVQYHEATRGFGRFGDQTAWCSSFANFVLRECGIIGTQSKAARSWLKWGEAIEQPEYGCIVVFWRVAKLSPFGHVAFFVRQVGDMVLVRGGNQGNQVSERWYPARRVLGYRRVRYPEAEAVA